MEAQVALIAAFRSSALLGLVSLIFLLTIPHIFSMGSGQVKSSHLYLYSDFNNTNCVKATAQYQNGKIVSIM